MCTRPQVNRIALQTEHGRPGEPVRDGPSGRLPSPKKELQSLITRRKADQGDPAASGRQQATMRKRDASLMVAQRVAIEDRYAPPSLKTSDESAQRERESGADGSAKAIHLRSRAHLELARLAFLEDEQDVAVQQLERYLRCVVKLVGRRSVCMSCRAPRAEPEPMMACPSCAAPAADAPAARPPRPQAPPRRITHTRPICGTPLPAWRVTSSACPPNSASSSRCLTTCSAKRAPSQPWNGTPAHSGDVSRSLFVFIGYCRGTQGARC